jgi:hypothetical protein
MNKKTYSQILDDVARDGSLADLDLTPPIMAHVQKGKGVSMQPRIKVLVTTIVIVFVLAVLLVNVPAVAAAIQRWFGYIPGFGLVHNDQIRELVEPVSIIQGDITLIVEKAILSDEKVVISYRMLGIDDSRLDEKNFCPGQENAPVLRLPDGRDLELRGIGTSHGGGSYTGEITYLALPVKMEDATLVIKCMAYTSPEQVPQAWEIPLRFAAASSASLTVVPVLEAPATVAPADIPTTAAASTVTVSTAAFLEGLALKNVIPTQTGYILSGTITFVPPQGFTIDEYDGFLEDASITDSGGQTLQYGLAPGDISLPDSSTLPENTYAWACEVYGENIQWPLTMTVKSLAARGQRYPQAEFQFDTGPNPKPGQIWEVNQDVSLGPKTVHIVSIKRIDGQYGGLKGYEFTYAYDPTLAFGLDLKGHEMERMGGGGSGSPSETGTITGVLAYRDPVPSGLLTVLVNGEELAQLPGPWRVTWQAPVGLGSTPNP